MRYLVYIRVQLKHSSALWNPITSTDRPGPWYSLHHDCAIATSLHARVSNKVSSACTYHR